MEAEFLILIRISSCWKKADWSFTQLIQQPIPNLGFIVILSKQYDWLKNPEKKIRIRSSGIDF